MSATVAATKTLPIQQVLLLLSVLLERACGPHPNDPTEIVSVPEPLGEAGIGLVR